MHGEGDANGCSGRGCMKVEIVTAVVNRALVAMNWRRQIAVTLFSTPVYRIPVFSLNALARLACWLFLVPPLAYRSHSVHSPYLCIVLSTTYYACVSRSSRYFSVVVRIEGRWKVLWGNSREGKHRGNARAYSLVDIIMRVCGVKISAGVTV